MPAHEMTASCQIPSQALTRPQYKQSLVLSSRAHGWWISVPASTLPAFHSQRKQLSCALAG